MSQKTIDDLEAEILELPVETRGRLAARLLESLEPSEEEAQRLWLKEAERRATEIRTGQAHVEPLSEAVTRIRAKFA